MRPNPGDKPKWKDKARTRLRRSHSAIETRLSMTITQKKSSRTVTTDRLQCCREKWRVFYTLTRVGADITSSLGMKTTTELSHQKCRRIPASGM